MSHALPLLSSKEGASLSPGSQGPLLSLESDQHRLPFAMGRQTWGLPLTDTLQWYLLDLEQIWSPDQMSLDL